MKFSHLFLFCLLTQSLTLYSQEEEYDTVVIRDIESWHNIQLEYKLNKKLSFSISEHIRLEENSLKLERFFTEAEFKYKIGKGFGINGGYRFITEQKDARLSNGHRWNIDALYSKKINRLKVYSRVRLQSKIEFPKSENTRENYLRLKLKLKYNIKNWKFDPYLSNEIFRTTNNTYENKWDKYRLSIGTNYDFNKVHSISFLYGAERDLNVSNPKTTFIVSLGYKFKLKAKKND